MSVGDLIARATAVTPGGIHSQRRQTEPPMSIVRAKGSKVWDAEGAEYIDFHNAYGCVLLGHGNPTISERVAEAIDRLDLVGLGVTPGEIELAEKLVHNVPCFEQVLLCNTGSEATLHAVRVARAMTGRTRVLKFQGAYHGTHDYLLRNDLDARLARGGANPDPQAGVLAAAVDATVVCRYNDLDSVRAIVAAEGDTDIAAIFVEPYAHNIGGAAPVPGFLEGLRQISDEIGALLVFDEVITGLRHGLGGYQGIAGVTPDLATMAKALGNGMPIAAIGGRRACMEHFNTAETGNVLYSGTFNGGGAPVAAALATIEIMSETGSYAHMSSIAEQLRGGLDDLFAKNGVAASVSGFGSVVHILLDDGGPVVSQEDVARNDVVLYSEFRRQMLERGVLDTPETQALRSYISLAHSSDDIERALTAADRSIAAAKKALASAA